MTSLCTPICQFFDGSGNLLNGGKIFTYAAGTTNQKATYTDSTGTVQNANPIILGTNGMPANGIYLTADSYKFVAQTSAGVQVWVQDGYNNVPLFATTANTNFIANANVTLAQTTLATANANQNSNNLVVQGQYWTGSASATDGWTWNDVLGTGANPSSTYTLSHSGSPGTASVSIPFALSLGTSALTAGSATITGTLNSCVVFGSFVSGSNCYSTTQAAVNAAGTVGSVIIGVGVSCSDSFTNNNNLVVVDLRDCSQNTGTLRVWSRLGTVRNVTASSGTFPLGNDLALEPAGAADLWFRQLNLAAVATATTFNVGSATTVLVSSTANFSVNAPIQVAREQTSEEALTGQTNCAAVVGAGNWSISDTTHFCIWPANNHSGTTDIEQQGTGASSLRATSLQPNNPAQLGGRNAPFRWQDVNLLTFMYWPINVVDTYPYNTVGLSVPLTGTSNATPTGHANLKLQNRTASDAVQMLASGGGVTFQCTDTICNAGTTLQSWNGNNFGGYSDAGSTLKYNLNGSTGLMSTYSGTATQGQGVSWIPGITSQKSETQAADANVLTVTPAAAAGDYRVCFTASVSSATNGVIGWTLSYTDSNGNVQANIAQSLFQQGTAAPALTFTTSAAGNYSSCTTIDVNNAAAAIIIKWVGGGTTAAKVSATVERLI